LKQGEVLDGEGGFCVWGKQTPAALSLAAGYFPLGLAQNVKLKRDVAEGRAADMVDVEFDPNDPAVRVRREMEARSPGRMLQCPDGPRIFAEPPG
jgi:predicted homoserine dehydrogenase-like protein